MKIKVSPDRLLWSFILHPCYISILENESRNIPEVLVEVDEEQLAVLDVHCCSWVAVGCCVGGLLGWVGKVEGCQCWVGV